MSLLYQIYHYTFSNARFCNLKRFFWNFFQESLFHLSSDIATDVIV